jgi:hypothetical protein
MFILIPTTIFPRQKAPAGAVKPPQISKLSAIPPRSQDKSEKNPKFRQKNFNGDFALSARSSVNDCHWGGTREVIRLVK